MIFYFSATGNCKYVAQRIASATKDRLFPIADLMKDGSFSFALGEGESVGIISPTYAWGLPAIVCDFLLKSGFIFTKKPYVWFLATYGTTSGQSGFFADRYMKKKGLSVDAFFSVKMPDVWTPIFDLSDKSKVAAINARAEPQIDSVIDKITKKECGDFMQNKVPRFAAGLFYRTYDANMRKTNHFTVEKTCIGCGLCAKRCPVNAIEMRDGKPSWKIEKCTMCLGCLHRCPTFSIQYGKNTKKHGQYLNPNVKA